MDAHTRWNCVLCDWNEDLISEFTDERPTPTDEDASFVEECLIADDVVPYEIELYELLMNEANLETIAHSIAVNDINRIWNMDIKQKEVYDENPNRVYDYADIPGETAKPSVMLNGEIIFGCARFIAALLRKDKTLKVWKLEM